MRDLGVLTTVGEENSGCAGETDGSAAELRVLCGYSKASCNSQAWSARWG